MSIVVLDVLMKENPPELYKKLSETPGDTCIIMTDGKVLNIDKPDVPEGVPYNILYNYYYRTISSLLKLAFDSGNIEYVAYVFIEGEVIDVEYSVHFILKGEDGKEIYVGIEDSCDPEDEAEAYQALEEDIDELMCGLDDSLSDKALMSALERDGL